MSFWTSKSGVEISGKPEDSWLKEFLEVIPNGTKAKAKIVSAELFEGVNTHDGEEVKEYRFAWKISEGDHKGREVTQKIKPFSGKPESIDRNLNALKLLFFLTNTKLTHSNAPSDADLNPMIGKELGIKVREWQIPKADGAGFMEGNFVGEVMPLDGFAAEEGKKMKPKLEAIPSRVDSAFSRNEKFADTSDLRDDIPF